MDDALEIIRGDDETIEIIVLNDDDESLIKAGGKFYLTVKRKSTDPDDDAIFENDEPISADTDLFSMDLSNTETELPLGTYHSDVQFKNEDGLIKTIYRGPFIVSYDITRRKN